MKHKTLIQGAQSVDSDCGQFSLFYVLSIKWFSIIIMVYRVVVEVVIADFATLIDEI
jgi:hypothetical protein